uniref:EAL domain-containing protein n=1 Tax=Silanimonas lenta TaxID=265429 RepID=UPI002FE0F2C3
RVAGVLPGARILLRADGEPFWARVVGAADLVDGRPVRLLGAFQDITRQRAERLATEQARQQLALAMQSGRIGVWHVDPGSGGAVWDDWVFRQYGREPRPGLVMAREWAGWLHPEDRPRVLAAMAAAVAGTPQEGLEFRVLWPDGAVRHLRAAAHPVRDAEGRVLRVVGLNWDVTPERELEQALRAERGLLQVTLRSIGDAVATTDGEGRLRWLNPAAERLCGMAVAEAAGRPCAEVFALRLEEAATPFDAVARCLGEGRELHVEGQAVLQRRDGAEFAVELSVAPIRDDEGGLHGAVLVLHDVTEQRRLDREMRFRATHDALTGLPNREALEAELQRALEAATAEAQGSALAVIDLDQFKVVNDTCGHAAGDLLLRQVARLFVDTVRRRDFVARIGGDEFAIVLHHCTPEQAQRVAQLICDRLETWRFEHGGHRFRIGASIGIAPIDDRFPDLPAVVQAADSACLSAKEAGRNRVHLWRDSDGAISQRRGEMRWAARLERALDEGGFTLYHQHILPGAAGRQAEILLRLREPDGEVLPAGLFLAAAERYHLATRIDRWVLETVLAALRRRPALDDVALLSVNLSGQSLSDETFHRFAVGHLERAGAAVCRCLCFEITETAAVTNLADARRFIERVRALGVRVALDDFGAGLSSFGYLKTLPVDLIKIDGQFIRQLVEDRLDEAAVRGFVEVARVLGVPTVAEFVDRPEVLERVRALGIDHAQGFLLHRPSPRAQAAG